MQPPMVKIKPLLCVFFVQYVYFYYCIAEEGGGVSLNMVLLIYSGVLIYRCLFYFICVLLHMCDEEEGCEERG